MIEKKYVLDLEPYMIHLEEIAKKYNVIEDIELCLFSSRLRYPIINRSKIADSYDHISNKPTLSLYSAPFIKEALKILIAKKSKYYKYFSKNHLLDTISKIDKNDRDKEFMPIDKIKEKGISLNDDDVVNDSNVYFLTNNKSMDLESLIRTYFKDITPEEVDYIDKLLCKMDEYITEVNIPCDYIIEINDEYISHLITLKEHILEKRISETLEKVEYDGYRFIPYSGNEFK